MGKFLKSSGNLLVTIVTILGLLSLFKINNTFIALSILFLILLVGFVAIISYQIINLEKQIEELEQKFKRADDLIEIKSEIKFLKKNIK